MVLCIVYGYTYVIKSKMCLRVINTKFFMKLEMELMLGQACILNR